MKKITVAIAIIIFTMFVISIVRGSAFAQTSTPQPTSSTDSQINELEQKIASRVAQLKLVERRGVLGSVVATTDTQITLNDLNNNTRYIDVDELTKFNSGDSSNNSFGISDIKKGDLLGILGLYNKQSERILARFVDVATEDKTIIGVLGNLDSKNFTASLNEPDGSTTTINFQDSTKSYQYTKSGGLTKSGFSKIQEGNFAAVIGNTDSKDKTLFDIDRIIVLAEISSTIQTPSPTDTPMPTDTPIPTPSKSQR